MIPLLWVPHKVPLYGDFDPLGPGDAYPQLTTALGVHRAPFKFTDIGGPKAGNSKNMVGI